MSPLPGNLDPHILEKTLYKMFTPEWLRDTAKRVGYVQRQRKVDPFILFWILVLGFGAGVQRSLAAASAHPKRVLIQRLRLWLPGGRRAPPAAGYPARQGVPRRSGCRPSRNKRRSGLARQDRGAGRFRWETRRWRRFPGVLAATTASAPASVNDSRSWRGCVFESTITPAE